MFAKLEAFLEDLTFFDTVKLIALILAMQFVGGFIRGCTQAVLG